MGRRIAIAAILALALAACGGSATPLTASQLAHKITGCRHFVSQTPSVLVTGDVTCDPPGSGALGSIDVVTFATMHDEKAWILRQGNYYGCCVEGRLWAATYNSPSGSYFPRIIHALGGREVTG